MRSYHDIGALENSLTVALKIKHNLRYRTPMKGHNEVIKIF